MEEQAYVMVPVPEEVVDEVREFVEWGLQVRRLPMTAPAALLSVVAESDDSARALLRVLARNTVAEVRTTVTALAAEIGLSTRELVGLGWELNTAVAQAGGSPFTVVFPSAASADADRVLTMSLPTAVCLLEDAGLG